MLIPGFLLKSTLQQIKNPKELAKHFEVSEQSMWIGLQTHNLINKLF
ncbi:hypothetical protein [Paenibacillus sp. B01]